MKVLISGASMAGLSAAYWFGAAGASVTLVERNGGLRRGGAPVDVRGDAVGTAERMGILDAVRARAVQPGAYRILGPGGSQAAMMDLRWFGNESDADVEVPRDDLNDIILAAITGDVAFKFSTSLAGIEDGDDGAAVTLTDGTVSTYDLVIGADGLHSLTRLRTFGPEDQFVEHQGFYVALVDLDPSHRWDLGKYCTPGLSVSAREVPGGVLSVVMCRGAGIVFDHRDLGAQRRLVTEMIDIGDDWELPRIREAFRDTSTTGFYFDSMSQTRMDSWNRGRVALIGDAASCASLLSGMGTSLAMTAAEYLCQEVIETPDDLASAFERFERRQRPSVDKAQASVDGNGFMMVPETAADLERRNAILRDFERVGGGTGK